MTSLTIIGASNGARDQTVYKTISRMPGMPVSAFGLPRYVHCKSWAATSMNCAVGCGNA